MSAFDWFKKAKEKAEEKKEKGNKGKYGGLASGSKAYSEAASALEEENEGEKKKEAQYASEE